MKKFILPTLLSILLLSTSISHSQITIAGEENYNLGDNIGCLNYTDPDMGPPAIYQFVGQTFRSSATTTILTVEFYVDNVNSAGPIDVEIYSCSAQDEWGSLLGVITGVNLTVGGWIQVDFTSQLIEVTTGDYYGFKLVPQSNLFAGIGLNDNLYSDGQAWISDLSGPGSFFPGWDFPFKISGSAGVLPVTLMSFTANKQNKTAQLLWSTATEQNSKDFTIQHSINGSSWNNISTIFASGNSNSIRKYGYLHTTPVTGMNYYRLQQNDLHGSSSYSKTRILDFSDYQSCFSVISNPVINGSLQVQVKTAMVLSLYNADGRLIWKKQFSAGMQNISVSGFPKGMYLLKSDEVTEKILIQ